MNMYFLMPPSPLACIRFLLAVLLLCGAALLRAQDWTVKTLPTHVSADGQKITVAIATYAPASGAAQAARHVLVYPQSGSAAQLKLADGTTGLALRRTVGAWCNTVAGSGGRAGVC